ncbi:hypothetical protein [Lysinibacillus sp. FSL L8-0126]|uniref:hypothetical protein n=1 Tax=Lysinibacillus sp. FSL L8-0126 TaxID=2921515 RepID=UPI00315AF468
MVNEEFPTGEQKNLYYRVLKMYESDLITLLMNVIQQAELNPSTLSYNSFARALKVTPLKKAYEITNTHISELPDIDVEKIQMNNN